jgi:hypothetical protein
MYYFRYKELSALDHDFVRRWYARINAKYPTQSKPSLSLLESALVKMAGSRSLVSARKAALKVKQFGTGKFAVMEPFLLFEDPDQPPFERDQAGRVVAVWKSAQPPHLPSVRHSKSGRIAKEHRIRSGASTAATAATATATTDTPNLDDDNDDDEDVATAEATTAEAEISARLRPEHAKHMYSTANIRHFKDNTNTLLIC